MPVREVREGMRVEPDHVYVIPANADLTLMDGLLHVVRRKALAGHHLPIDYFLRSLAETRKSRAIGVILSGTGSDGTAGLTAVKMEGGVSFAQSPDSAKFDGMPRTAIAAGCVDFVLPPERIAAEIGRLARHPLVAISEPELAPALPTREQDWARLFRLLREASGVDFSLYKPSTITRRMARRMALRKIESIGDYLKFLDGNREEIDALFQEILIHVTGFFRDPDVFTALRGKVFARILGRSGAKEPIRIWVPGCSTGEEVYSIAICLLEHLGDRAVRRQIQIFGTDVSEVSIEKARAGIYSEYEMRDVSPQRRRRFFTPVKENFQVNPAIRELCVFARHEVTKDPAFSRLDLLSCRNLLIYMKPPLQKKVLASFHYALKDSGVLLLGKSEGLGAFSDLFRVIDRKNKFFARNAAVKAPLQLLQTAHGRLAPQGRSPSEAAPRLDIEREADRIVWERYAHAGIVVDGDLQILHFRGDTSRYLQPAPGKASFNLSRILHEDLQSDLSAAIKEARKSGRRVRKSAIAFKHDPDMRSINMEVCPLRIFADSKRLYLILFEDAGRAEPAAKPASAGARRKAASARELRSLQNKLARTREYLQSVIREQDSTNAELKTANEEALSSMEELQSTNQELETAKEELQSTNEELVTLNDQLQNRNAELGQLSDDLTNLITGVDIPIVILGADRRIRRFTPPAQKLFGLQPDDIGRPIGSLHLGINIPDLKVLISSVMQNAAEVGHEIQGDDGHWYRLRLRPFRTSDQKIDGVLIALMDIHEPKLTQDELQKERNFVSAVLDAAHDLLVVVLDRKGRIVQFNRRCQETTGYTADEVKGRRPWEFLVPVDERPRIKEVFSELLGGKANQAENHWNTKDGRRLLIRWSNVPAIVDGSVESVIATGIDHTERADALLRFQESEATVRALLETAAQAIVAVDKQGRIVLANATTERMFGYAREELIGQPLEVLIPERFRKSHLYHRNGWFSDPRNRRMGAGLEIVGLCKNGAEFPVEIGLSYISSGDRILGVAFIGDISERKQSEEALLDYQKRLQRLAGSLLTIQESGNRDLARELHDVFSQELAALRLEVSTLLSSPKVAGSLAEPLAALGRKIGHLADEMHRTSRQLHPAILSELGLEAAMREECSTLSEQIGIPVQFVCENLAAPFPGDVALALYRVAQESLRNIRKHSGATGAHVSLRGEKGGVALRIEDTGDGFDLVKARKSGGLGLISMEERIRMVNGRFEIQSQPGIGTTVDVFVPLK
jgi:two-component system CheB/CheR fusion protein